MRDIRHEFARGVLDGYQRSRISHTALSKSIVRAGTSVGHPDFDGLGLGESAACTLAVGFIDMTSFTARSFWDDPYDLVRLSVEVLTQVAMIVEQSGGHVLGLRGDGLMAGWGSPGSDPNVDTLLACAAAAVTLDAGDNVLRELLELDGIEPVQLRAGIDHGTVHFVRTGTENASEVNIIGFPANFAAKCEKYANSWEVVIGETAAEYVAETFLNAHPKSPKTYEHNQERRTYRFYDVAWRRMVGDCLTAISQVAGSPTRLFQAIY